MDWKLTETVLTTRKHEIEVLASVTPELPPQPPGFMRQIFRVPIPGGTVRVTVIDHKTAVKVG